MKSCNQTTFEDKAHYVGPKHHHDGGCNWGARGYMTKRCAACRKRNRDTADITAANKVRTVMTTNSDSLTIETNEEVNKSSIADAALAACLRAQI